MLHHGQVRLIGGAPTPAPPLSETAFQTAIVRVAKQHGWLWYHTHDSRRSPSGFVDGVLAKAGYPLYLVELKTDRGQMTPAQEAWMAAIAGSTGVMPGVWRPQDGSDCARQMLEGGRVAEDLTTRPVAHIQVGPRHRTQLGDLQPLANSLHTIGLLHPIVITPDNQLVAGARRLAAAKRLGWVEIPVRVTALPSMLQAEHDENVLREPFLPTEAVAIGRALEDEIFAANARKMREAGKKGGRGKKKDTSTPNQEVNTGTNNTRVLPSRDNSTRTTSQVGTAVGMSGTTYTKAKAVVRAAEKKPELYGDLVVQMDVTGNVDRAYQTMRRRQDTDALARQKPPPGVPRRPWAALA